MAQNAPQINRSSTICQGFWERILGGWQWSTSDLENSGESMGDLCFHWPKSATPLEDLTLLSGSGKASRPQWLVWRWREWISIWDLWRVVCSVAAFKALCEVMMNPLVYIGDYQNPSGQSLSTSQWYSLPSNMDQRHQKTLWIQGFDCAFIWDHRMYWWLLPGLPGGWDCGVVAQKISVDRSWYKPDQQGFWWSTWVDHQILLQVLTHPDLELQRPPT